MIIQFLDGRTVDVEEKYRVKRLFHRIPSLIVDHKIQNIEGRGGIIVGSNYNKRTISVQFLYDVDSIYGYYLLRDELNALFTNEESFYIIFKRENYKRYKVKLADQFNIEPSPNMNSFDIDFLMVNNFAESLGSSIDLQNNKGWDDGIWGFGSNIDYDTQYNYTFNTNNFVVKNIGNQKVDPRESNLDIRLKGSFNSYLQLTNSTTGDVYRFNDRLTNNDELLLTGVRSLKNGLSSFSKTNRKLIRLAPGENNITVEGGTIQSAVFDFRFLYK